MLDERDAWGQPLHLQIEPTHDGTSVEVRSFGPDGVPNTADDLQVSRLHSNEEN